MEEKLYFKPGNYGKGRKKKQTEQKVDNAPEKKDHKAIKLISLLLFLLIVVIAIVWLLRDKTTTSGQYPENIKNESLSCVSTTTVYEKVNERVADSRELKINAVFYGKNKLSSIGVRYTQEFPSDNDAYAAHAFLQAQLWGGLQKLGYDHSRFNNKFSLMDNVLVLTLQTEANEIDELTREYFLVNRDSLPTTLEEYRQNYESQGFACTSSIDNN